jgi:glycosyltransferase involved in cell wall biosynthesis
MQLSVVFRRGLLKCGKIYQLKRKNNGMRILVCTDPDTVHSVRFVSSLQKRAKVGLFWFGPKRDLAEYKVPCFSFSQNKNIPISRLRRLWEIIIFNLALLRFKPDLIHVHREARWVKQYKRWAPAIPVIFTSWGHISSENLLGDWGKNLIQSDGFTGDSPVLLDELLSIPGCEKVPSILFRFGISEDFFCPAPLSIKLLEELNLSPGSKIIYSARSLRPGYNHQTLLKAVPEIINVFPNTYFIFVNNHGHRYADALGYRGLLQDEGRKLGISDHLRFLEHHKDRSKIAELMQTSDVVVSIPPEDAFPATIFEAMACGAPLIVSDLRDYDEIVDDSNAIRISPADDKALADAIKTLLGNDHKRMALRSAGLKTAAIYGNMELEVDRLYGFYQKLTSDLM